MKNTSNTEAINKPECYSINTIERYVHNHTNFISICVKMGGTSSSIPNRLNNSNSSASLLRTKNNAPHESLNEPLKENSHFPVKVNILKLLALFTALKHCGEE